MLTTKVITPKQGESYYAKENYYSAEESIENSQWFGKGAKELGLRGKVKPKQFKKLLYGELPNGTKFRNRNPDNPKNKERAGLDCTFSAPKSVSTLALVGGDEQVENAHKEAVKRTLKIIERDYAATRVKKNYQSRVVNTGNLVVGQFHHDTSRELDPHLHTHCVILNMTKHNNKLYAFHNDGIHANKKMLGMIYQNELAIEIQKLGYEIEPKENGQFEIKGFKEQDLQSLSKRRQQIKAELRSDSTWKDREKIWDKTRIKKGEPIPREELQNYWRQELSDAPFPQPLPEQAKEYNSQLRTAVTSAKGAVAEAIEHSSERNVAFKPETLKKFILEEVGKYSHELLHNEIVNNNELIHLDKKVTTQTALLREINTIRLVKDGQGKVEALSSTEAVTDSLAGLSLTEGQQNAVVMAATTNDQIIAWQGKAGVGKTYALNTFKTIAQNAGYTVKGFAPSAKAAGILSEEMSIQATTVARKLVSQPLDEEAEQQQIWIVDEAGLLGAKDAHELLQKAKTENARVLLVGDTRQLSSVAAGNPFKSLQQAGMTTAHMNQSLRQKTKDLKQAVNLLSDGHIAEGIKILETNKRIEEISNEGERASRIASDYLKLSPFDRKQTLIIAGTHRERQAILDGIRNELKAEGSLGNSVAIKRLKSKNLTNVQKNYAHNYDVNNVVVPLADRKRLGLEKNQRYLVKAVDRKTDSLILIDKTGAEKRVSPAHFKYKEVYDVVDTDIAEGDRLRWGKNDKELNRTNGEEFTVSSINDDGTASITTETGNTEQINLKKLQHLDHALVSTTYSSQGMTSNRVLVSVSNNLTLSQESFYVAASRAKYNLQFYVEDKASLIENASKSRAQQNPLELIREHQRQAKEEVEAEVNSKSTPKPTIKVVEKEPEVSAEIEETKIELTPNPITESEFTNIPPESPEINTPTTEENHAPSPIMDNSPLFSSGELELLNRKTQNLTERLEQLATQKLSNKEKQVKQNYLEKQLLSIQVFSQLSLGQQVSLGDVNGTITALKLSPGGLPEAWVQWDNSTVPIAEQPHRLQNPDNTLNQVQNYDPSRNSQQPQPNNDEPLPEGFSPSFSTNRRPPRLHNQQRIRISSESSTRSFDQTDSTSDPSLRPDGAEARTTSPTVSTDFENSIMGVQLTQQQLKRGSISLRKHQPKHQRNNRQLSRTNQQYQHHNLEFERIKRERKELTNQVRNTPLLDVVERLGLQQDRYDQHKYKSDSHIISINENRFYDHLNLKGGGGAIDLVMHVQGSKFKDAVDWLNGAAIICEAVSFRTPTLSISKQHTQHTNTKPVVKKEAFIPPVADPSKWDGVKDYLVTKRGLPESLINLLHKNGSIYADSKQNAVFLRKNLERKVTGASLRGTFNDSKFKGLAKGTERDTGWFMMSKHRGDIQRIILTESPIDAMSAAALTQKSEPTLFISIDGNGAIPEDYLKEQLQQGKEVIVAFDNDRDGNFMAQKILAELKSAERVAPRIGKDWNERLLLSQNPVEEQKWLARQEYEQLSSQVLALPNFDRASPQEVDTGVAMFVIKNSIAENSEEKYSSKVFQVLAQSDTVLNWKKSMPDHEYQALAKQYVVDIFNTAVRTRESMIQEQQQQQKPSTELEM